MKPIQTKTFTQADVARIGTTPVETKQRVEDLQAKQTPAISTNPEPAKRAEGSLAPMHDQIGTGAGLVQARVAQSTVSNRRKTRGRTPKLKVTPPTALAGEIRRPGLRQGLNEVLSLQTDLAAIVQQHAD